jgi:hypothetical protein
MTVQAWFTESVLPAFTQDDRDSYRALVVNQMIPIGNEVNGRRLIRCMTDDFQSILDFLTAKGKCPRVCGVRDFEGNWIVEGVVDGVPVNVGWKHDQTEYAKHMQPVAGVDIDGNPVMVAAVGNTSAGWYDFNEVPVVP